MKLATKTGDFNAYTNSQIHSLKLVREAGFKYADYTFHFDYCTRSGVYSNDYEKYVEDVKRAAETIGIKMVQAHSPLGKPLEDDDGQFLLDTLRCVDACGAWGIPNLVVHTGYRKGLTKEQTFDENKKFFQPILERAEKYGVNILAENFNVMWREGVYWIDNATDLLSFIEYVNHPLMHVVWDVGHANLQPMNQEQEIKLLNKHVLALHIQDNDGISDLHQLPFLGTLNMDLVMHGLKNIGYKGYFTFEVGETFTPPDKKRQYSEDNRLLKAPLEIKMAVERLLYDIGKYVLTSYDCFEE